MAWIKWYFDGFQILSALCWPPSSLLSTGILIIYSRMRGDDVITELFLVTENEQEGHGVLGNPSSLRILKQLFLLKYFIFQDALLAISTEYWYLSFAWAGPPNSI